MVDVDGVFSHFQATPLKLKRRAPTAPTVARRSPPQNPAPARRQRVPSKMVARQPSRTKLTDGVVAPSKKRVLPVHPSSAKKRKLLLAMPPPDDDNVPVQQKLVFDTPPRKAARTHVETAANDNDTNDMLATDAGWTPPRPETPPVPHTPFRSETPRRPETPPRPTTPPRLEVLRTAVAPATQDTAFETPKKCAPPSRGQILSPLSYLRLHSAPTDVNAGPPPFSPNVFDEPRRLEPSAASSLLPPTPPLPPSVVPTVDLGSRSSCKPAKRELLAPLQTRRSARLQAASGDAPPDIEALTLERPSHLRRTPGTKVLRSRAHTALVQAHMDTALAKSPPTTSSTVVALSWASIQEMYAAKVLPKTVSTALHAVFTSWMLCEDVVATSEPSTSRLAFAAFDQSTIDLRYDVADTHGAMRTVPVLLAHYAALYDQLQALTLTQQSLLRTVLAHVASVASAPITMASTLLQHAWTRGAPRLVRAATTYFATITAQPETLLHKLGSLAGSLLRHVLRAIFLSFDARLDAGDSRAPSVALPKALYAHHDLGAAVHRALVDRMAGALDDYHTALCVDFLATAFQTLWRYRSEPYLQAHIAVMEKTAARIAALGLDDEAYLAPLAALGTFVATLEKEQRAVASVLARAPVPEPRDLLSCPLPEKESTPLKTRFDAASGCFECKQALRDDAIVECRTCHHKYHLACLYLPLTFRDPSRRYVCPHCL
ncbi:hypothetical protein SDRG_02894 [Saprolegnia diclina VS20]|uniref:PHD-type domain-containing protein n=1 Tax=Saprolegnia diclina (strain VS20) TaxID=1156394 RepID=T0S538_SAPDV|nr:hypothetical protein SDRG_02894 [Saprolegnia diclina VS20]EQC40248.1 hypothetical protein SDRG_02894 [Saprolegnia diclina VS20]|eukprot:XP_008606722.1 hypothetical protein SDRG_02894 [Saprolegnia diclina VS20]